MSEDKEKPPVVIDGTRVVCPDHGIRGVRDCCGDAEPKVDPDEETSFDIVEEIKKLVQETPGLSKSLAAVDPENSLLPPRGPVIDIVYGDVVIDKCGSFDFDKVARELTDSLSNKMAVMQTEKGANWLSDWLYHVDREFLYGPSGKPPEHEPRGLLRADIVDPDPEC